jgi:site-specific DNA-methyltransferase (cytosine-N4-specific)
LPKYGDNILSGVITSPPYCNRYDYTRTYALELAYLGITDEKLKKLRQELLSCTVENKPKIDYIKENYEKLGKQNDFDKILKIIEKNKTLAEVNQSLKERSKNGDINNKGVLRMVDGYFTELCFIYAELFRLCKSGAKVAFVNDNVRYGGEVISVDYLSTELAEQIGFKPIKVYSLKQQKGNSSQQMAKFGRVALRKSITVWEKP